MHKLLPALFALLTAAATAQSPDKVDASTWTAEDWRLMRLAVSSSTGFYSYQYIVADFSTLAAAEHAVRVGALNASTAPARKERRARYLTDVEPALRPWMVRLARPGDITLPIARKQADGSAFWSVVQLKQRGERGPTPMGSDFNREVLRWVQLGLLPSPKDAAAMTLVQAHLAWRSRLGGPNAGKTLAEVPAEVPVNIDAEDGQSPLTMAVVIADVTGRHEALEALLRRGADPNHCAPAGCPLPVALASPKVDVALSSVERLLAAGAKPDQQDQRVRDELPTALTVAAYRGHRHALDALLAAGARLDPAPGARISAIEAAAMGGQLALVEHLAARGASLLPSPALAAGAHPGGVYDAAGGERAADIRAWAEPRLLQAAAQSPRYAVELGIEQDGKALKASAPGEWQLAPRPFQLVVRFPGGGERVMVAASLDADWLAQLNARDLRSPAFRPFASGALPDADRSKPETADLLVMRSCPPASPHCEGGYNVFDVDPSERQDFHERRSGTPTTLVRDIERLLDTSAEPMGEPAPVTGLVGRTLMLAVGVPLNLGGPDGNSQRMPQQQVLKLRFVEPNRPASPVKAPAKRPADKPKS
ncbi:ankyrin repeat domain-containing protein [Roseateles sp.]|uniref:ankyrin repeat domain-containing protein n=1 Tax=Roseateles sp. TaxID=1971397 RepID=UPI00396243A9